MHSLTCRCFVCIVFAFIAEDAFCQVIVNSSCPLVGVERNFSLEAFSGVWHEIESYPSQVDEFDICNSLNYTLLSTGFLQVVSTWFNTSSQKYENAQGSAKLVNPRLGAKLQVGYTGDINSNQIGTAEGNYWVLETDYVNYAIVYLCVPGGHNNSARFVTYLSRERFPFKAGKDFVRERIRAFGLDPQLLKPNDQTSCPILKER